MRDAELQAELERVRGELARVQRALDERQHQTRSSLEETARQLKQKLAAEDSRRARLVRETKSVQADLSAEARKVAKLQGKLTHCRKAQEQLAAELQRAEAARRPV